METLSITEVCRRTGLSARSLRFYETRGLITAQRSAAGQRRYGPAELARLHQVTALKRAGFSLSQIGALLGRDKLDLARMIEAQLASLAVERDRIDEAVAALTAAQARLSAGRALDIETFCTLIKQGEQAVADQAAWQEVYDRYYTPEEQAVWIVAKQRAFAGMDMEQYSGDWKRLTDRIEAALPLDPASMIAREFLAEWKVLQAPFEPEYQPLLDAGAFNLYEHMDEWSNSVEPPFSKAVWEAMKAASAAQRAGTGTPLE